MISSTDRWGIIFGVAVILEAILAFVFHLIPTINWVQGLIIALNIFCFGGISFHIGQEMAYEEMMKGEIKMVERSRSDLVCDECCPLRLFEKNGKWLCAKCFARESSYTIEEKGSA